jgi:hypothetical protein
MPYQLYDYVGPNGTNEILAWMKSLQKKELGKLNARLDMLALYGTGLRPQVLAGTDVAGIQKLRVHGSVQLRPLLCEGPQNVGREFTLLAAAKEVQSELRPRDVLAVATDRKRQVVADMGRRRKHERP